MPNDLQKPSPFTEESALGTEGSSVCPAEGAPAQPVEEAPARPAVRSCDEAPARPAEEDTAHPAEQLPSQVCGDSPARLLLHACCGPCTLEPSRVLREQGYDITVYYANSNIEPAGEYAHRRDTLKQWAADEGLPVVEGPYDNAAWRERVADCAFDERAERCRACYRVRFEESARYAAHQGFDAVGTTLSVSPYQHTDIIREELERAAALAGVAAHFEDYRPFYDEATRRSRDLGLYRQNYCGCALSAGEAARERAERKEQRKAQREAYERAHAAERAQAEEAAARKRAEKQAYAERQARKRQILRQMRADSRSCEPCDEKHDGGER